MTITVYSKPSCVQCAATYRALDKLGFDVELIHAVFVGHDHLAARIRAFVDFLAERIGGPGH